MATTNKQRTERNKFVKSRAPRTRKLGRSLWTTLKGVGGGALGYAAVVSALAAAGITGGAALALIPPIMAGTISLKKAINNYRDKDFFGKPSNKNADITGKVNPDAKVGNEDIPKELMPKEWGGGGGDGKPPQDPNNSFWWGEPGHRETFDTLTPEQKQIFNENYLPHVLNQIGEADYPLEHYAQDFDPFAQRMRQDFNEQIAPNIRAQYGNQQGTRGKYGSVLAQLAQARRGLESDIGLQRTQFAQGNREAQRRYTQGAVSTGFSPQQENVYVPRYNGVLQDAASSLAAPLGNLAANYFGGKFKK